MTGKFFRKAISTLTGTNLLLPELERNFIILSNFLHALTWLEGIPSCYYHRAAPGVNIAKKSFCKRMPHKKACSFMRSCLLLLLLLRLPGSMWHEMVSFSQKWLSSLIVFYDYYDFEGGKQSANRHYFALQCWANINFAEANLTQINPHHESG